MMMILLKVRAQFLNLHRISCYLHSLQSPRTGIVGTHDDINSGPPFPFHWKAIVYRNKYLISLSSEIGPLVAYQICSGRKQALLEWPDLYPVAVSHLAALDEDLFCFAYTEPYTLVLVTFWLSISREGPRECLACGVLNKCKIDIISYCRMELFVVSGSNAEENLDVCDVEPIPGLAEKKLPHTMRDFPDDVMIEILSRLPGSNIVEFRRVCRKWNDLISTWVHMKACSSRMILIDQRGPNDELLLLDKWEAPQKRPKIHKIHIFYPNSFKSVFRLSYNGLIVIYSPCLSIRRSFHNFIIFNPLLREKVRISSKITVTQMDITQMLSNPWFVATGFDLYGMFFNASIKEYCLLLGSFGKGPNVQFKLLNLGAEACFRDLKQSNSVLHKPRYPARHPPVVVGDATLYWLVISSYSHETHNFSHYPSCKELIMVFDTKSEELAFMPHPGPTNDCNDSWHWNMHIVKMHEHLSFLQTKTTEKSFIVDIWKLEDSATRLWVKSHSVVIGINEPNIIHGLRGIFSVIAVENGEMLLAVGDGQKLMEYSIEGVYVLNIDLRTMRRIGWNHLNTVLSCDVNVSS